MHYTEPLYRSPVHPGPYLEVTQGCTHNRCKFCNMYKNVKFKPSPIEWIDEDAAELAQYYPHTQTLQFIGANPFALPFHRLKEVIDTVHRHLPDVDSINMGARVTDVRNKTVEELRELHEMGISYVYFGVESGDDWTLERIDKGYRAADVVEQVGKLDGTGILYSVTYLNGVAGRSHSREHALRTAEVFNQLHPHMVGGGSLTLFPDVELAAEAQRGEFDPLTERERLEELVLFLENLEVGEVYRSHHTVPVRLDTDDLQRDRPAMIARLKEFLETMDEDWLATIRRAKTTL